METTLPPPPVQNHSFEKVKGQTTPTLPRNPVFSITTKESSGNAASTSPIKDGSRNTVTATKSLLNQSPKKKTMYSSDIRTSAINVPSNSVGNDDTSSTEQLESLLASALLNAQQTLNSIQTLSYSVGHEGTISVNSSGCGLSRTGTNEALSALSSRNGNALHNKNNREAALGQSECGDGAIVTNRRGGSNKMTPHFPRQQLARDFELSALDEELAATLNTRESEHSQNQRTRQASDTEALCSSSTAGGGEDFEITGLGHLWNIRKNNLSIARNCPKKKSSSKHTQERSLLKDSRSGGRLKTTTGVGAVTSTPSYVGGGNGMISHRLESLLGSTIEGEWVSAWV